MPDHLAPPAAGPHPRPSSPFHPPFYNRPPTPLPTTPSFTSLLRVSRPASPYNGADPSSDSDTPAPPRRQPKVPTYEYYGFVLYILSNLSALLYVIWALAPRELLEGLGITYYPSRWWSVVVPSWLVVAVCYVFVALAAVNVGVLTKGLGELETVVDEAGRVAEKGEGPWRARWNTGTDAVMDVPLGGVCEVLYGEGREREREEWGETELRDGDVIY